MEGIIVPTNSSTSSAGRQTADPSPPVPPALSSSTDTLSPLPQAELEKEHSEKEDTKPSIPLPSWRRWLLLFTLSWIQIPMIFSSSSALAAVPEISSDLGVSPLSITTTNAGVFLGMAFTPFLWLPAGRIVGRRTIYLCGITLLFFCSIGSALAPNLAAFACLWILGATSGVTFLVFGQTIIADIFEPTRRGTAVGIYLSVSVVANMLAPMMGGIIAAYTTWRVTYGVQGGMTLFGLIMAWVFVPCADPSLEETEGETKKHRENIIHVFSPLPILRVLINPSVLLATISCGMISFAQYGMLSATRYSINERFNLTSPLTSGLFFLAPGAGFLVGTICGGRLSDRTVKRYMRKRNGLRIPRDRLRNCLPAMIILPPTGLLLFGWSLEEKVGGLALPAFGAFVAGAGLMAVLGGFSTFLAEVVPDKKTEAIASKCLVQYSLIAGTVASQLPMLTSLGVGRAFTITSVAGLLPGLIMFGLTRCSK